MKLKVVIHQAEEGGCRAEVPAIAGCATQGKTHGFLPIIPPKRGAGAFVRRVLEKRIL